MNILLLFTDQQRWDSLGCTGSWGQSPYLDRLAAEGVRFSRCVTNSPVCVPARMSLATGWYPHNTGIWRNARVTLPSDAPMWVRVLRDAGYRTSLFGKIHLRPTSGRIDLRDSERLLRAWGFDDVNEAPGPRHAARAVCHMTVEWERRGLLEAYRRDMGERLARELPVVRPSPLGADHHYDVYIARQAANYLCNYSHAKPWFCWVGFPGPHEPWDAPEPYASMYNPDDAPDPIPFVNNHRPAEQRRASGWHDRKLQALGGRVNPRLAKRLRANYAGKVTLIDDMVGEIIRVIRDRGELDRTVVIFSSDHGEMNGDFGLTGKANMFDSVVRVPLIIRIPGMQFPNTTFDRPVELIDLGPTIVELAGAEPGHTQFGRSLVRALADPDHVHRTEAMVELRHEFMLFDEAWKMTLNARGVPYLLYDLRNDPQELANLAGRSKYRDIEQHLTARLLQRIEETQLEGHSSRLC